MRLIPDSDILFDRDHAGSHLDSKQRPPGAKGEAEGFQKVQNHDSCPPGHAIRDLWHGIRAFLEKL